MNRGIFAGLVVESTRANPERCVLWVIEGSEGVVMWDLLKTGETPQLTKGLWALCGPVAPSDEPAQIVAMINAAFPPPPERKPA